MSLEKNIIFFDKHAEIYSGAHSQITYLDKFIIQFIKKRKHQKSLLDVGGGSGEFGQLVKINFQDFKITVMDPSKNLLSKIKNEAIGKICGSLPLNISINAQYDYLNLKYVLHHLIGKSIKKSMGIAKLSLESIKKVMSKNGILFLQELYYESPVFPTLSRNLIFLLLKLQNALHFKIPIKEFLENLQVCFYTRKELKGILKSSGFTIVKAKEIEYPTGSFKPKVLLLKRWGSFLLIARKRE